MQLIALNGGQLTRNDIHLHTKRYKLARKTIDTNLLLQSLVIFVAPSSFIVKPLHATYSYRPIYHRQIGEY